MADALAPLAANRPFPCRLSLCSRPQEPELQGLSLLDTVRLAKPDALIGLTGQGGIFSDDVLTALVRNFGTRQLDRGGG